MTSLLDELDAWITEQWDPSLTVGEWWDRLGVAGWSAPHLPASAYGKDASLDDAQAIAALLAARAVPGPQGAGLMVVAPTIAAHGTPAQIEALLRPIVTGRKAWCLLFSEPEAGSDLASLTTTAQRDGDEWRLDGRKTWATGAHRADMAVVLARSDPESSRHHGLTCFALDMLQGGGIEVRPMREMTGRALSNNVTLNSARVADRDVLGGVGHGWTVVNTALTAERHAVGAHHRAPAAPGTIPGDLCRRVGDLSGLASARRTPSDPSDPPAALVLRLAATRPARPDAVERQALAQLHALVETTRLTSARADAARAAGDALPGAANLAKLAASELARLSRDTGLGLLGPRGSLHAYDRAGRAALELDDGDPLPSQVTAMAVAAQAASLTGGVDRLQRDLLGERVLGLPKGPAAEPRRDEGGG